MLGPLPLQKLDIDESVLYYGWMISVDIAWIEEATQALEQELIKLEFLEEALDA